MAAGRYPSYGRGAEKRRGRSAGRPFGAKRLARSAWRWRASSERAARPWRRIQSRSAALSVAVACAS